MLNLAFGIRCTSPGTRNGIRYVTVTRTGDPFDRPSGKLTSTWGFCPGRADAADLEALRAASASLVSAPLRAPSRLAAVTTR